MAASLKQIEEQARALVTESRLEALHSTSTEIEKAWADAA